jgi:redox-sensitive bicupin YhaK (pirin superfamily)
VELRLYSGTSGGLRSPTRNHVPVTLADLRLEPGATVEQDLPVSYNGFFYASEDIHRLFREFHSGRFGAVPR